MITENRGESPVHQPRDESRTLPEPINVVPFGRFGAESRAILSKPLPATGAALARPRTRPRRPRLLPPSMTAGSSVSELGTFPVVDVPSVAGTPRLQAWDDVSLLVSLRHRPA